ncbi:hypothetical protein GS421_16100 [Rhodococcus hoagii]|nr:hypothetical protein [Prescottella equi]
MRTGPSNWPRPGAPAGSGSRATGHLDHTPLARPGAGIDLVRSPGIVEQLREVKDEGEIELLRRACAAADDALATLVERGGLRPGRTRARSRASSNG